MKKALVVGGGEMPSLPTLNKFITECEIVIGADLGAEHLLLAGRVPDVVVGDMDSCSSGVITRLQTADCEIIEYPKEKDFTDLEAAIDYAVKKGYKEILVVAALHGRRIDHVFGNVFLLPKYTHQGISVRMCDEGGRYLQVITDKITITGRIGAYVSMIPLTLSVTGVNTSGLKYPLENQCLQQGNTLGMSNELVEDTAEITLESGMLLVIKERDR